MIKVIGWFPVLVLAFFFAHGLMGILIYTPGMRRCLQKMGDRAAMGTTIIPGISVFVLLYTPICTLADVIKGFFSYRVVVDLIFPNLKKLLIKIVTLFLIHLYFTCGVVGGSYLPPIL